MFKWYRFEVLLFCLCGFWMAVPTLADPPQLTMPTAAESKPTGDPKDDTDTRDAKDPKGTDDAKDGDGAKDDQPKENLFIRLQRDDRDRPLAMETAIVTYVSAGKKNKGVKVDLLGAVHVGDATYYDQLNRAFEKYDVLLYELVAPEGTKIPKGGGKSSGGLIRSLQGGMKTVLELESQLEKIDYTKKNFVHADMSPQEFAKSMKDRGESFLTMFIRMMLQGNSKNGAGQVSDTQMFTILFSKDRALGLKRIMANQFTNMDGAMSAINGPDGSAILTERNKKCLTVLQREIEKGHKKIGIFYGAAHLPDMDKRLHDEFGMQRDKSRWLVAWDLASKKPAAKKTDDKEGTEDSEEKDDAEKDDTPKSDTASPASP